MTELTDIRIEAKKDETGAHPVASAWRPTLKKIVSAFVEGDYSLSRGIPSVTPVRKEIAQQIEHYLADYGDALIDLPSESWKTSIAQWMETHWEVLVDLWTEEQGESDLVLSVHVFEDDGGVRMEVDSVHVP